MRPALCLTSEIGKYSHIIIAFISSQIPNDLSDGDLILRMQSANAVGTGLTVDSVIRLHKIVTIPKSLIKRKLGSINGSVELEVKRKLKQIFEIE